MPAGEVTISHDYLFIQVFSYLSLNNTISISDYAALTF